MKPEPTIEAQLQERELGKIVLKSSGFFEKYGLTLVAVILAVVVVSVGYSIYTNIQNSKLAVAWSDIQGATLPADMEALAEKFKGTPPGDWALLRGGELRFDEGMLQVNRNREVSNSEFQQAKAAFEKVLGGAAYNDTLRERALFGLARVLEATSTSDTKPAIARYEELVTQFPQSIFKPNAEARIKALGTPEVQAFYEWFSKQNPKPEAPIKPRDGTGSALGFPGFDLPGMTTPPGATGTPATESPVKPDDGIPPAASPTPATTPAATDAAIPPEPAAAKPEEAKPEETKPTEAKPEEPKADAAAVTPAP